jgi:hypothetical protein
MSYSLEDFFEEKLLPGLKQLFSSKQENITEEFFKILENAVNENEKFARKLLCTVIPEEDYPTVDDFIKKCFNLCYDYDDSKELRKIEYSNNGAKIVVDYKGLEQELEG